MFREDENLKDSSNSIKDNSSFYSSPNQVTGKWQMSYTKTDKLITALYMVTDIIDKDEPLRNKLRILGMGIISDMNSAPLNINGKITEIMSFLDIAHAMNIISEMNCNILKKEFFKLSRSINESFGGNKLFNGQINLSEFFQEELSATKNSDKSIPKQVQEGTSVRPKPIGHHISTSIGVQKGSTLMKALSDRNLVSSISLSNTFNKNSKEKNSNNFDVLKKQRRNDIINVIKDIGRSATITDIKNRAQGALVSCSEKTLQRELVSMMKDGVLDRMGEKRWSRYFVKN